MEISFHSHLESNRVIATKFCTWHDSCAVVACAKMCSDLMASNGITARRSFHRIWIAGKKSLVKRAPGHEFADNNMVCAKLWPDWIIWIKIQAEGIFARSQLWIHNLFVDRVPAGCSTHSPSLLPLTVSCYLVCMVRFCVRFQGQKTTPHLRTTVPDADSLPAFSSSQEKARTQPLSSLKMQ